MSELYHHGIKGQKWGVRRFQNPDGTLTIAGKKRKDKEEYKQEFKENLQKVKTYSKDNGLKATIPFSQHGVTYDAARLITKYKDMSIDEAFKKSNKNMIRGQAMVAAMGVTLEAARIYLEKQDLITPRWK